MYVEIIPTYNEAEVVDAIREYLDGLKVEYEIYLPNQPLTNGYSW